MLSTWATSHGDPNVIAARFASVNGPTQGPSAGPYESWSVQYGAQPTITTTRFT